ncbi:hypothetical protein ZYGR_0S00840 [Zygosaccharomyces rouxii]|uniref:ZYRO0F04334p n=2 Tax=Zygosaccharomyces rouxii TaxID=4956 RepID=C5DXE3_ZYGRC|nr:uncharacterized protein ZYRO0F04334g [Zygosaccharomyces rouxii]KAH9199217.1 pseudouridine synthase [Zygosaccharomyces rouxii]GAV49951.1 hypothetical protein ZYGR_0S00840 [Zygosaccharomyces rouxii]CAR28454.1 ZYRO0F04334p [Zygosaccharomyces rouxii]
MGVLQRLFRLINKPGLRSGEMSLPTASNYSAWTKEQLIEKIVELENHQDVQNSKKHKKASPELPKTKRRREFDFSKYNTRFIALKFSYLGWNYNGLAVQKDVTPLPTVEGVIIDALMKCRLVASSNVQDFRFSRCGRTDKGVSAMNQVISLEVRSNLSDEEQKDPSNDTRELQYAQILNHLLPEDIKISAMCLRPPEGFDARYSCEYRHYKYLFSGKGLMLDRMQKAAALYHGEHDFRNFCKLDGSKQITNYTRNILGSEIQHISDNMYCFDLVGSAFLWHQVRCMMAILFLVGQGLEEPSVITNLLDVDKTPQKPIYEMASDLPLILYDCKFPEMEWIQPTSADYKAIKYSKVIESLNLHYQFKATVANMFAECLALQPDSNADFSNKTRINVGDGVGKVVSKYEKMVNRQVMDSAETVNEKYRNRKNTK